MRATTVDFDFFEKREAGAETCFAKFDDLLGAAGLLWAKLIARKSKNRKARVFMVGVELFKAFVLGCETTLWRCVYHQEHLAPRAAGAPRDADAVTALIVDHVAETINAIPVVRKDFAQSGGMLIDENDQKKKLREFIIDKLQ